MGELAALAVPPFTPTDGLPLAFKKLSAVSLLFNPLLTSAGV